MLTQTIRNFVSRLFSAAPPTPKGPQRLGVAQHHIDRRLVSRHAIKVCEVLQDKGYEAYIVGGAVRDLIVGLEPKDFDVATNATPEQVRALFRRARIIGRRFKLVHVVFGREIIETSTFRTDAKETEIVDAHGRILQDNDYGELKDDALRRDFTLNALYYDPTTETVIDYHNGVHDLTHRTVRIIGDATTRYREDPVRMLRAVRFAAKLDATIDPTTHAPIPQLANLINHVPESRLFDESIKLLSCGNALHCLKLIHQEGLHQHLFPQLDLLLADEDALAFIDNALARTDSRVRSGRTISPSFLFATLLWPTVKQKWLAYQKQGQPAAQAIAEASDEALALQAKAMPIQKRFQADMREIWFTQARFDRVNNRAIWRMLEQPRFRASVDFLQLRAAVREVDSVEAQWWMDLANADTDQRAVLIAERTPPTRTGTGKRPRRRTRRPRHSTSTSQTQND
ncbi:MAG TPA: polynucleotide adenylyltransferase PcnB [Paenalcaligenes hominis]|uniref:Poly(A) polymerase I n=1 Tax=Paenalcaligenes hominis TaxID=643674 RepID=A0A9D2VDE4_9BURK|nr:polynucleotide adenylyltransferase PcnB [Paenalcaligenes hominis]NJB64697.1 poly(A) polymerase [Paenalcaligenes hominis]GGE59791.1 poly(A) polymerase I [Paenalcaligenes hominis]HJH22930.1 polynucleotide adenylyltransferase PcnB [Paenalcaligenes hominis]